MTGFVDPAIAWGKMGGENGGGAGTRTPDTGIMIPLLYRLSYAAPEKSEAKDTGL